MKITNILLLFLCALVLSMESNAQATAASNAVFANRFLGFNGAQDVQFRTDNLTRMTLTQATGRLGLGITAPTSIFHISTTATGDVFKSDGPTASDNRWQLFTSGTERFRIRTFANGFDTWLERTQAGSEADLRLLTAEVQLRARNKRLGDFCEFAGALADEVTMGDGTDVNFNALALQNRRLFVHGSNGFVGMGHRFRENGGTFLNPNYQLHLHDSTATGIYQQWTNLNTGDLATDGLRIGLNATLSHEIRSFDNGVWLDIAQSDTIRMRFRDLPNYTGLNGSGYGAVNRIMVPLRAGDANVAPMSMMQLGTNSAGNIARSWMNVGTSYGTNADAMYVGWMERANATGGATQSDAIISWGCQRGNNNNDVASDNFRILFLAPTGNNADSAGTAQGKEVFRIEPFSGNVGIGNFSVNSAIGPGTPGYMKAKLDINGDLRIRRVTEVDTLDRVLVIDPLDSNRVHYMPIDLVAPCDWNLVNASDLATGYAAACRPGIVTVGATTGIAKLNSFATSQGTAIYGEASFTNAINRGVFGYSANVAASENYGTVGGAYGGAKCVGGYFYSNNTVGLSSYGSYSLSNGLNSSGNNYGAMGIAGNTGNNYGVYGSAVATANSTFSAGLYASVTGNFGNVWAVYANGNGFALNGT